ncbi:MAG TPA: thiamine pyrophosphate-dependent enzyme [Hyphomicrobium sp.]|nr:thiamine pyrophosphate-dependent enzyme [Hyphomicrobium sp.]
MRSGGKILIDGLARQGSRLLFTVPGESFLPALDALFDEGPVRTIVCRHEGAAAMMAEAAGKLTGAPGVAFVTRAPGATNAASGVYVAHHDATPMLLLVGLPARAREGRKAFQEIDLEAVFGTIAKRVEIVRETARISEAVAHAFQAARSGRPGPVVLGFPEDVLNETAEVADAAPIERASPTPSAPDMRRLKERLAAAKRPLVLIGGGDWSVVAAKQLAAFAAKFDIPVAATFRRQDHFDNRHPSYVGHAGIDIEPELAAAIAGADLLIIIGETPGEVPTAAQTLIAAPDPSQALVHAHPSPEVLGRLYRTEVGIVAAAEAFCRALARLRVPAKRPWRKLRRELRAAYERALKPLATPGSVQLAEIIATLSRELPEDAIVTNGAGNYAGFLYRYFQYKGWPTQLAPTSGSMGYGLPAAIAAKLIHPERAVVALAGDGCALMTGQELATAVQYGVPIVLIIANNGMYGTIRMHQERLYPGRVVGTSLVNPDFAALARSFGAAGLTIGETREFLPALQRALTASVPTVIELKIDPEAISARQSLSEIAGSRR